MNQSDQEDVRQEVHFSGRVQGVGFRYTTRGIAARFSVTGYVKNLPDGQVLVVVEGPPFDVDRFIAAIEEEMQRYIQNKQVATLPATDEFAGFEVRR